MALEMETDKVICCRCGKAYGKRRGNFRVSYAACHKGLGYIPICGDCIDSMYNTYLAQCKNTRDAVRQMCRKLDLYWNEVAYMSISKKSTTRTVMSQYIQRISTMQYAGKSYDDTLSNEGTLWSFSPAVSAERPAAQSRKAEEEEDDSELDQISEEIRTFWGPGYSAKMYLDLEQRRSYWMSRLPEGTEVDIGTEALIRQICQIELDINRSRVAGRDVDKLVTSLDKLIGSAGLKPGQRKDDGASSGDVPFGVGIAWCEKSRPIAEPAEEFKDVDGIRRYISVWLYGHLAKMLGKKNLYSRLYEEEIAKLRVERPEFVDEDDEEFIADVLSSDDEDG